MEIMGIDLFSELYKDKKVLITGHTGFIGSWLTIWLLNLGAEVYGYALEATRPEDNFNACNLQKHMHHKIGDILNFDAFKSYVEMVKPDIVFHLAAQSLVINSYANPKLTLETNILGTINFFEAVRSFPSIKVAINSTSDKCYQIKNKNISFTEDSHLGGNDPYSASKACSELITQSYYKSFFQSKTEVKIASVRSGNVIGGGDWNENRIVPDAFRSIKENKPLRLRNEKAIRPWQFVLEPLAGYLKLGEKLFLEGDAFCGAWNFGPSKEHTHSVLNLVQAVQVDIPNLSFEIASKNSTYVETEVLMLDSAKALRELGWKTHLDFMKTIKFTSNGYRDSFNVNGDQLYSKRLEQIQEYCKIVNYES